MKGHQEEEIGPLLLSTFLEKSGSLSFKKNLKRPVIAAYLENVLNDFQTSRMAAVVEEQIKSNMLFFHVNLDPAAVIPPKGQSQEGTARAKQASPTGGVQAGIKRKAASG
ncbi:hypothetical protein BVRB_6g134940 [Beta vulgaris subsp. vulgaris]|nr:hypothetical protein BVRB_6g134940 [Beta vulgaris subsp. vulgaris]